MLVTGPGPARPCAPLEPARALGPRTGILTAPSGIWPRRARAAVRGRVALAAPAHAVGGGGGWSQWQGPESGPSRAGQRQEKQTTPTEPPLQPRPHMPPGRTERLRRKKLLAALAVVHRHYPFIKMPAPLNIVTFMLAHTTLRLPGFFAARFDPTEHGFPSCSDSLLRRRARWPDGYATGVTKAGSGSRLRVPASSFLPIGMDPSRLWPLIGPALAYVHMCP